MDWDSVTKTTDPRMAKVKQGTQEKRVSYGKERYVVAILLVFLVGAYVVTGWSASSDKPVALTYNMFFPAELRRLNLCTEPGLPGLSSCGTMGTPEEEGRDVGR
jgi:hypothetical protein